MIVKSLLVKGVAGVVAAGAAAGGVAGATGAASASPGAVNAVTTAPATSATSPVAAADPAHTTRLGKLLRHIEHGEFVVATKNGDETFAVQRGEVTAVNATTLVVTSHDGYRQTYVLTSRTRQHSADASTSAITPGERVAVVAKGGVALRVRELPLQPGDSQPSAQQPGGGSGA